MVWTCITMSSLILLSGFQAFSDGVVTIRMWITNRDDRDHRRASRLIGIARIYAFVFGVLLIVFSSRVPLLVARPPVGSGQYGSATQDPGTSTMPRHGRAPVARDVDADLVPIRD